MISLVSVVDGGVDEGIVVDGNDGMCGTDVDIEAETEAVIVPSLSLVEAEVEFAISEVAMAFEEDVEIEGRDEMG